MLNRPTHEAVEPIVVVLRIDTATVEVQVATIRLRVERGRPVVTVRATIVAGSTIPVTTARKEGLSVATFHDIPKGHNEPSGVLSFSRTSEEERDGQPVNIFLNHPYFVFDI